MLTEKQKLLDGQPYHSRDQEIRNDKLKAISFLKKFHEDENPWGAEKRLKNFLGAVGSNVKVSRDFDVTFGYNLHIGNDVSINRGCKFLDAGKIRIGDFCYIGPCAHFYTASHPLDPQTRIDQTTRDLIITHPITVKENVWIGGNCTILPGVTIGKNSVIGAGSVVTKNVPSNVVAADNPARVIKKL